MKKTEVADNSYQRQVNWLRFRRIVEPWPGKSGSERAESRYPNIAAEILASDYSMYSVRTHARVSDEILAAVIEDNEELTTQEMVALSRLWWCRVQYLYANTLQLIDPSTNKGKRRHWDLQEAMKPLEGIEYFRKSHVESVCNALEQGKLVTYAHYRWAMNEIKNALRSQEEEKIRSTRIAKG